jgi:hypothetical protein
MVDGIVDYHCVVLKPKLIKVKIAKQKCEANMV